MTKVILTWYGRCCFLIEIKNTKILIDPHDQFDGVCMGNVDADYTLISSAWHDHGHVGASPKSIIVSEPGETIIKDLIITGIETKESRGTRNIIFNIRVGDISLTNFADLGDPESINLLSSKQREIIQSTNIAFVRPNQILHEPDTTSGELALRMCNPKIIIPHHFYPKKFIDRVKAPKEIHEYLPQVEMMIKKLSYKKQLIDDFVMEIDLSDYQTKTAIMFSDIHPQVTFDNQTK